MKKFLSIFILLLTLQIQLDGAAAGQKRKNPAFDDEFSDSDNESAHQIKRAKFEISDSDDEDMPDANTDSSDSDINDVLSDRTNIEKNEKAKEEENITRYINRNFRTKDFYRNNPILKKKLIDFLFSGTAIPEAVKINPKTDCSLMLTSLGVKKFDYFLRYVILGSIDTLKLLQDTFRQQDFFAIDGMNMNAFMWACARNNPQVFDIVMNLAKKRDYQINYLQENTYGRNGLALAKIGGNQEFVDKVYTNYKPISDFYIKQIETNTKIPNALAFVIAQYIIGSQKI